MQISYIHDIFTQWKGFPPTLLEPVAQAGSSRQYFRLFWGENESCIATYNPQNITENQAFIYFTAQFQSLDLAVPQVLFVSEKQDVYFQTDNGNQALMDILNQEKYSLKVYEFYQKALQQLAQLQIKGDKVIDYHNCIGTQAFDKQAIEYDLHYFLFYFVNALELQYYKKDLFEDFEKLATYLSEVEPKYFLFRDFQSRNIMVKGDEITFIDYQSGMKGALQYDVVSLLWQAKAALPQQWKNDLLDVYFEEANRLTDGTIQKDDFYANYPAFILIRILQTFGSYGFRGLFERRPYFLSAIPAALAQLKDFLQNYELPIALPALEKVLHSLCSDEIAQKFQKKTANADSPLVVKIFSFSYKKGIPADTSTNGGGFVFDCRSLHNPGRYDEYKELTGRDESVKTFLLTQSKMPQFLQHIYPILDIAIQNYLERGFDSLMISFGCTGGKHRSVFSADSIAKYLKDTYKVKIELEHIERGWEKEYL